MQANALLLMCMRSGKNLHTDAPAGAAEQQAGFPPGFPPLPAVANMLPMPPVRGSRPMLPLPPGAASHVSTIGRTAPHAYADPLLDPHGAEVIVHFDDSDEEPDVLPKAALIDQQSQRPKPIPPPAVGTSKRNFVAQKALGGQRHFPKPASKGGTPPLQGVPADDIQTLRREVSSMG